MANLRSIITSNKLYAWMAIAMLLMQPYAVLSHRLSASEKPVEKTAQNFAQEIEANKKLLQKALAENPQIAANFAYLSFFILVAFLTGIIFLVNFLFIKSKGIEPIPKTLQEHGVAWSWGDAVKIVIIFLFFNHIFSLFGHILKGVLKTVADKRASMVLDTVFMDIFVLLLIVYFVVVKYKQKIDALGISSHNIIKNVGIAIFGYLAFLPILAIIFTCVLLVAKLLNYTPPQEPIYELIFKEQRPHLLMVISAMVAFIGPVIEEIFFRGFLYSALKKSLNITAAMLITACIFSLLHTNVLGFVPITALGLFLAYLREKTGSLIPSITVHIIHNSALASLMFLVRQVVALA